MSAQNSIPGITTGWLASPRGQGLLREETRQVADALESVFGDHFLQIGHWGGDRFLPFARTRRAAALCECPGAGASAVVAPECLGIQSDSVDAVLLPHVLETNSDPHSVLREVDRVLRPEGQLIVLGFNPLSLWGVRHTLSRRRFPAGVQRLISESRLRDWLSLLNFTVQQTSYYFYHAPLLRRPVADRDAEGGRQARRAVVEGLFRLGRRVTPLAACYAIVASKELFPMTVIRPAWKTRPRLVSGLVNPTTRNAA